MKTSTHSKFLTWFILSLVLLFGMGFLPGQAAHAEDMVDTVYADEVNMILGELTQLKVYSLTRLSMTDPEIADVVDADDSQILLIAKNTGQTPLFIWDEYGKRVVMINVSGTELTSIADRLQKLFTDAGLKHVYLDVNGPEGKVVITGTVPEYKQILFEDIVSPFDEHIISLVEEQDIEDLVQIDVQITELSTTLTKSLGIDWFSAGSGSGDSGSGGGPLKLSYGEDIPTFDGSVGDFFKIGDFRRADSLVATVNDLLEEGMGRILSQPKLVVLSGEEASFLIGGEIPIRTTTSTGDSVQENVEFKEYGVGMTVTPTIRKEKIDVILNIEISDIDAANAVGEDVAFTTRSASSQLFLDDGQTIVLAGLIQQRTAESIKKVPYLGEIPILGLMFRSRSTPTPDLDTELVISLTPYRIDTGLNPLTTEEHKRMKDQPRSSVSRAVVDDMDMKEAPKPMATSAVRIPDEMKDYVREVQRKISQQIVYPREAREYGWEGTVKLGLHILNDGTLAYALVKESSGHEVFDDYALNTAKNSAPYNSFPSDSDLQELNITIPIVYSLQRN